MKILYLDFDGVLHPDAVLSQRKGTLAVMKEPGHSLFENAPVLEQLLRSYQDVRIVLNTSWAWHFGCETAKRWLPQALQERVIGCTEEVVRGFRVAHKGIHVAEDMKTRQPSAWVAIDNEGFGWTDAQRSHLVLCDDVQGLGKPETRLEVAAAFNRNFGPPRC